MTLKSSKLAQSIVGTNHDGGRPENDFYPTPPEGTLGLLKVETFDGPIDECLVEEFCHDLVDAQVMDIRVNRN